MLNNTIKFGKAYVSNRFSTLVQLKDAVKADVKETKQKHDNKVVEATIRKHKPELWNEVEHLFSNNEEC